MEQIILNSLEFIAVFVWLLSGGLGVGLAIAVNDRFDDVEGNLVFCAVFGPVTLGLVLGLLWGRRSKDSAVTEGE